MMNYTNNKEYRQCLRQFFQMNSQNYPETIQQIPDLDDETLDEMSYDESAATKTMDYLLDVTKNNKWFNSLYDLAAAKMISMDREIGLAVLMSYDYLQLFQLCIHDFMKCKDAFDDTTESYVHLQKNLK